MRGRQVKYTKEIVDEIVKESNSPSEIRKKLIAIGVHPTFTFKLLKKHGYGNLYVRKNFSQEEDESLLKEISKNPYNLSSAFEKFAEKSDRTEGVIRLRYYKNLRKKNPNRILLVGNSQLASNTKNVARGRELHPELVVSINGIRYQSSSLSSINISF